MTRATELKTRIAGRDCRRQLPFEDLQVEIAQNNKFLLDYINEVACRECDCKAECVCEADEPTIGGIVPPVEPLIFDGIPFENLYANGKTWVGNVAGQAEAAGGEKFVYRVYNPNGTIFRDLKEVSGQGGKILNQEGGGGAWDEAKGEVFIAGQRGGTTDGVVVVYDDETALVKRELVFDRRIEGAVVQNPIEVHPVTHELFVASLSVLLVVDPSDGTILRQVDLKGLGATFTFDEIAYLSYRPGDDTWLAGDRFDITVTLTSALDVLGVGQSPIGGIGGLGADLGWSNPESAHVPATGFWYLLPATDDPVFRLAEPPSTAVPVQKFIDRPAEANFGMCVEAFQRAGTWFLAASWPNDVSFLFTPPQAGGFVSIHDAETGSLVKMWPVDGALTPARISYVPESDALVVVSWDIQRGSDAKVQWLRLSATTTSGTEDDPPPINVDPDSGESGSGGEGGTTGPSTGGGEPSPPSETLPSPCSPPSTFEITSHRASCASEESGTTRRVRVFWDLSFSPHTCDTDDPADDNVHEIGIWDSASSDPATDAPLETIVVTDPDAADVHGGLSAGIVWDRTGDTGDPQPPRCDGYDTSEVRERTFRVRRNRADEKPGAWSDPVALAFVDPLPATPTDATIKPPVWSSSDNGPSCIVFKKEGDLFSGTFSISMIVNAVQGEFADGGASEPWFKTEIRRMPKGGHPDTDPAIETKFRPATDRIAVEAFTIFSMTLDSPTPLTQEPHCTQGPELDESDYYARHVDEATGRFSEWGPKLTNPLTGEPYDIVYTKPVI